MQPADVLALDGRSIDTSALTPDELSAWLQLLIAAGGDELLELSDTRAPSTDLSRRGLDPAAFRVHARRFLRHRGLLADEDLRVGGPFLPGTLGDLVHDLECRLGLLRGWNVDSLRYDPRQFLRWVYEDSHDLRQFAAVTGIDYTQCSRLVGALSDDLVAQDGGKPPEARVGVAALARAARNAGIAFSTHRVLPAARESTGLSCRDIASQNFGQKLLATWLLAARDESTPETLARRVECLLSLEARVRFGDDVRLTTAFSVANSLAPRTEMPLRTEAAPRFFLIELDPEPRADQFAGLAWLFLAAEFRWFEEFGWIPLIVEGSKYSKEFGDEAPVGIRRCTLDRQTAPASAPPSKPDHWLTLYLDLIHRPLYHRREPPKTAPAGGKDLSDVVSDCQNWALKLFQAVELRPVVARALRGWSRVMHCPEDVFSSVLSAPSWNLLEKKQSSEKALPLPVVSGSAHAFGMPRMNIPDVQANQSINSAGYLAAA